MMGNRSTHDSSQLATHQAAVQERMQAQKLQHEKQIANARKRQEEREQAARLAHQKRMKDMRDTKQQTWEALEKQQAKMVKKDLLLSTPALCEFFGRMNEGIKIASNLLIPTDDELPTDDEDDAPGGVSIYYDEHGEIKIESIKPDNTYSYNAYQIRNIIETRKEREINSENGIDNEFVCDKRSNSIGSIDWNVCQQFIDNLSDNEQNFKKEITNRLSLDSVDELIRDNAKPTKPTMTSHFDKINQSVRTYYRILNREYKDEFKTFIEQEQLIDPEIPIEQELGDACNPNDCVYTAAWDNNNPFPIPHNVSIPDTQKEAFIFYILQYCYKNHKPPSLSVIKQSILPKIGVRQFDNEVKTKEAQNEKEFDDNVVNNKQIMELFERNGIATITRISTQGALEFSDFMNSAFCVQMKDGWEKIMAQINKIENYNEASRKKAAEMQAIHVDYFRLLLKTRSQIRMLMTQCNIQKQNISELLEILKEGHKNTLSGDDKLAYQDCINCLGKCIEPDIIRGLIDDWKNIVDRLDKAKDDGWVTIVNIAIARQKLWEITKSFVIGVVAGIVAFCVTTFGAVFAGAGIVGGAVAGGSLVCHKESQRIKNGVNYAINGKLFTKSRFLKAFRLVDYNADVFQYFQNEFKQFLYDNNKLKIDSANYFEKLSEIQDVINTTEWYKVHVFEKINVIKETTLSMSNMDFIANVSEFIKDKIHKNIIITSVETILLIVRIFEGVDIGILLKHNHSNNCDNRNNIEVNGIYLDKQRICDEFNISYGEYDCLDHFKTDIDELIIHMNYGLNTNEYKPLEILSDYSDTDWETDNTESVYLETDWDEWEQTDDELDEKMEDISLNNLFVRY